MNPKVTDRAITFCLELTIMKNTLPTLIDIVNSTKIKDTQYTIYSNHIEIYSPTRLVEVYFKNDKLIVFSIHKTKNLKSTVEVNLNSDDWEWWVNTALKINECYV